MADFAPIFNEDENTVLQRMFQDIDDGWAQVNPNSTLDKREGSAIWLLTYGTAKELARAYSAMNDVAELAFVQFLQDDFLTDKALEFGLTRIAARAANTRVTFYGTAGTSIPIETNVTNTTQFEDDPVYSFETQDTVVITSEAAPGSAPAVGSGGLGDLTGLYSYLFTFVEVNEEGQPIAETGAGPASGNFTATNNAILVTGFPTVPDNHRLRIYRTPSTGTASGTYKLVAEISDPSQAQFLDRFIDEKIGSYFLWDGLSSSSFDPTRQAGPITANDSPAAYVDAVAVEEGELYNLAAGDLNFVADGVPGVSTAINHLDIVTGRDLETDAEFLPRVLERIQNPQGAGTQQDYIDWCLEVPGISFVTVHPNFDGVIDRPGYVHVVVRDAENDPVGQDVLTIIREGGVIAGEEILGLDPSPSGAGKGRAPIGAKVVLQTVRKDLIRVTASIKAADGYALVPSTGQVNLQVLIDGSLAELLDNVDPGATIYESAVLNAIYATEGVEDVIVDANPVFEIEVIDAETLTTSTIATTDPEGNWALGKAQVLEYDGEGSTFTEV